MGLIDDAIDLPDARSWRRHKDITCTVVHTWQGIEHKYVDEPARPRAMHNVAAWWDRKKRSGTQFLVTGDVVGYTVQHEKWWKAHCHSRDVHWRSVGIEIDQHRDGRITLLSQRTAAELVCELHDRHGLQYQCQWPYVGPISRIRRQRPITVGCFGHRDVTSARSIWDPGDPFFEILIEEYGFEPVNFAAGEDLVMWRRRQEQLRDWGYYGGAIDGIPGPKTTRAAWLAGKVNGIWARGWAAERPDEHTPEPWLW